MLIPLAQAKDQVVSFHGAGYVRIVEHCPSNFVSEHEGWLQGHRATVNDFMLQSAPLPKLHSPISDPTKHEASGDADKLTCKRLITFSRLERDILDFRTSKCRKTGVLHGEGSSHVILISSCYFSCLHQTESIMILNNWHQEKASQ